MNWNRKILNDDKYLKLKTSKWGALEAENQSSEVLSLSFDRVTSCFKQRSSKKYKKFKSVSTIIFWEIATILSLKLKEILKLRGLFESLIKKQGGLHIL